MAPSFKEMGDAFGDMWRYANENREKFGCQHWIFLTLQIRKPHKILISNEIIDLGKTSTLFITEEESGNSMIWISYWKSLEGLEAFSLADSHRVGFELFEKGKKKYPHCGIMHETYSVPKGHWETIYGNFKLFGFGT
jgi:hypothetical protein